MPNGIQKLFHHQSSTSNALTKQLSPNSSAVSHRKTMRHMQSGVTHEEMKDLRGDFPQRKDSIHQGGRQSERSNCDVNSLGPLNWYEVRAQGKNPERRGYHSSFVHNNR
jgi:hypothetical protein